MINEEYFRKRLDTGKGAIGGFLGQYPESL